LGSGLAENPQSSEFTFFISSGGRRGFGKRENPVRVSVAERHGRIAEKLFNFSCFLSPFGEKGKLSGTWKMGIKI